MSSIVFTFGRFSPPTIGHQRLVSKVVETAKSLKCNHAVFISQTVDTKDNPLEWDFKRRVCEAAFKGVNISNDASVRSPFIALDTFIGKYDNVILVVGQDQLLEFQNRMTKYAEVKGFNFSVISAGNRIVESEGIEGISATKMRQYAREKNKELFFENLPTTLNKNIKTLVYNNTRKGLKT